MSKKGIKRKNAVAQKKKQLPAAEYDKLKYAAYQYIVMQGLTQKQTAELLGVTEVTMSAWAKDNGWRDQRQARQATTETDVTNTKQIIRLLSAERLELETQIRGAQTIGDAPAELEYRKKARVVSDEISKHNKVLQSLEKESRYTLGELINVMDDVFKALREYDEELFMKIIPFQEYYVRKRTIDLG
ncbi:hypothetical protein EZS27_005336 [termite gut metagenome]|uniref:Uncharacterized protein n=1 Tax=termite gut metagenome TaxID=433724 RepID=A0A5J4SMG8_9ZZZZ